MTSTSIVVVGCGPSAFILSLYLQKYDIPHQLVISRPLSPGKVGESLLPSIVTHFRNLNLPTSPLFKNSFVKHGVNFKSSSASLPLRFDSAGPFYSFNLDRYDFDKYLLDVYNQRGGKPVFSQSLHLSLSQSSYSLEVSTVDSTLTFTGLIIDASGSPSLSSSSIGNHYSSNLKNKATVFWSLVSLNSSNTFQFVDIYLDNNNSWFWHIPIKSFGDKALSSFGYVSPLANKIPPHYGEFYRKFDLNLIGDFLNYPTTSSPLHKRDFNYIRKSFFDKNLVLCGDSAAFVDPMMSSGVHYCSFCAYTLANILRDYHGSPKLHNQLLRYEVLILLEYLRFHQGVSCLYTENVSVDNIALLRRFLNLTSAIGEPQEFDSLLCFEVPDVDLPTIRNKLFKFAFRLLDSPRVKHLENISRIPAFASI